MTVSYLDDRGPVRRSHRLLLDHQIRADRHAHRSLAASARGALHDRGKALHLGDALLAGGSHRQGEVHPIADSGHQVDQRPLGLMGPTLNDPSHGAGTLPRALEAAE